MTTTPSRNGLPATKPRQQVLRILNRGQHISLPIHEIERIVGYGNYSVVHANGQQLMMARTLKSVSEQLDFPPFVRVHKKSLINKFFVVSMRRKGRIWWVRLRSGEEVSIARRKTEEAVYIQTYLNQQ